MTLQTQHNTYLYFFILSQSQFIKIHTEILVVLSICRFVVSWSSECSVLLLKSTISHLDLYSSVHSNYLTSLGFLVFKRNSKLSHLPCNLCSYCSLSRVQFFVTPWAAACQAPLSSTVSQSLLTFMSIESVMLSNHVILYCPFLLLLSMFPSISLFQWVTSSHQVAQVLELQPQ